MKKTLLLILSLFFISKFSQAQVTLTTSPYVENFDGIGSSLPNGFGVYTSATGTALGTSTTYTNVAAAGTAWNNTSGTFKNFASGSIGLSSVVAAQTAASNRALGIRQVTASDAGVGFAFQMANTTGKTGLKLSFDLQSLDASSPRVTTWRVDYGFGASPTTFTVASTTGTLTTGGSSAVINTIAADFGTSLDNISGPIWIRIVAINPTTGSGNRPSSAIDNFNLSFTSGAAVVPSLSVTPSSLDFGTQLTNTTSAEQTYTLNSANLNGTNVILTTTAPYAISKTSGTGFGTSLTYTNAELSSGSNTIYTNFTPTTAGTINGSITTAGGGVAAPPTVSLTGVGQSAVLTADQTALDFGTQNTGTNSTSKSYTLSASGLTKNVTVSTNAPFSVSKDNTTFSTSITYTPAELASAKTVSVRFSPTAAVASTDNVLNASAGATTVNVALSGTGTTPAAPPAHVVISEVYGGGGNSGATYKNDFIELYNPSNVAVDLTGWSVQYAAATGTTTWAGTNLTGSIPARGFYLIQAAVGAGGTVNLPTPDAVGTLALSGTAGKVLLASTTTLQSGAKPTGANIIDLVGFGTTANAYEGTAATPAPSNTLSIERKASASSTTATLALGGTEEFAGNGYDSDNNNTDFVTQAPNPQNSTVIEPTGATHIVIAEVYGGGGNSGATYKNDFIELYNPTAAAVDLTGWSVQYASATGTGAWSTTVLSGSIAAKSFYLIQEAAGAAGTLDLPTPDKIGTLNLSGTAGKVLLSNTSTAQTGIKPTGTNIIDLVGFGTANGYEGSAPAVAATNTTSVERKASASSTATTLGVGGTEEFAGNGYDSDDNAADFVAKTPNPQNSTVTEPASTSGPNLKVTPTTLAFSNQAVNTTSASKTYVLSGGNLTNPVTVTTSAPFTISKDDVTFSTSLNYTAADLASNQTIFVRFKPTATGNSTGAVMHSSAGATAVSLALTGPGVDPNQTAFNFENCTTVGSAALSDGFYQYSVTGPQTWGCTTTFGHDAADATGKGSLGNALQINGYSGGNILNEDWLISPALNLSAFNYAILSFWTRSAFAGDKLQLKISTNYTGSGNPALATWTSLDGKFPETGTDVWTKSDNIDLTSYKATPVYVAIIYNSTTSSASRWTVDDFQVLNSTTPPAVDISTSPSSLNFGFQASGTTSAEKTFGFSAGNLTGDVTLTAPANFTIAKTSGGTFANTISYLKTDINNTAQTVYAKFSPTTVNTNYSANVNIATSGSVNKTVNLSGNTFDIANSLEVVNWNIEWFGSPAQDPKDDTQQAANVKTVVNNLNADIYGFAEVVDTTLFRNTILPAGYNVIFSDFGSYADNKADADYPLAQKLAFMYRTDIIHPINSFGVLRDTYNPAIPSTSVDGTPFKNWSSGRFPYLMEAQVKINNKLDTVYFIEIHAKANTGTTADQIDAYNRRKDGNAQFKTWLDANLKNKKVIILGDFNDVLDPDKTIAPMPAGTGTSYSDFTNDAASYFPLTLPLSLAGKQSTAGFATVIDNVIVTKNLNTNYIPASAEVLDAVKNLVTNYSTTTTDHYPIKTRYLFGNGVPTLDLVADQKVCYNTTNLTIPLTGISAGPETSQTTTLSVTSDNPNLFDVLTVAANGSDKGTITYHLKNNVSGVANISVTVMDNGGTDFGGIDQIKRTFKLTVTAAATATLTGTTAVCLNGTAPVITFTGANGTAPYTFTYNINGGTNQTITTAAASNVATVTAPANVAGNFAYNLVSVSDGNCALPQTATATVTIRTLATATISGTTAAVINTTAPNITFTGANGTAPYTFSYNINGGATKTVTSVGNTATVAVPTNAAGTFTYNLLNVTDVNCGQAQSGSATVIIRPLPVAAITGTSSVCINGTAPVITFTGSVGTAPYTFTYNINGGSNRTVTSSTSTTTINAPSNTAGTFVYNLVSVADAYTSQLQTGNATVIINPLPVISISSNKGLSISKGDAIILTATGGVQYTWTGAEILSGQNSAAVTIRPKQSGNYRVVVTNANGCTSDQTINIQIVDDYKLEAGTVITPNGDGINDKFVVKNIDYYPNNTLKIFDKAGRILYTKQAYNNDWDGTVNGNPLAEGTYYYILDMGPGLGNFKGFINIIRD
ncbi:lamin tail domain-containing protein [Pedobacter punctiformis]|uniref:Lamin tail domain-containing protein n=1 Tax=Pedobacter punctiformis TaxID=3004097 RepID=A0ABT4L931_9SPHI|nr:lamin tail domain-containing protein [Pedobacter sp. HCMS5-2]MCZ4244217.1 lamin tail domain-containing protein [Pedobacter sp. HCMS5-2]